MPEPISVRPPPSEIKIKMNLTVREFKCGMRIYWLGDNKKNHFKHQFKPKHTIQVTQMDYKKFKITYQNWLKK